MPVIVKIIDNCDIGLHYRDVMQIPGELLNRQRLASRQLST